MKTKELVLIALESNRNNFTSGAQLAEKLNISRQAVWKAIQSLQQEGYPIDGTPKLGYRLANNCDIISATYIEQLTGIRCLYFDVITSTTAIAKQQANGNAIVVVANEQTDGKARDGKFPSPKNGVYFTLCLPTHKTWNELKGLRENTAKVTQDALRKHCGIECSIRDTDEFWQEDKKLGGILTECTYNLNANVAETVWIGIGLYTLQENGVIPNDTRNKLIAEIINNLQKA